MMEVLSLTWMADPTAWAGFVTLVMLELVLGIDNLVFIAILAQRLPPKQRDRARRLGLMLALALRIMLLASISWMVSLTKPLFSIGLLEITGKGLVLVCGGAFLLFKATLEIHHRLEGHNLRGARTGYRANFWAVILQIVILDAVFSLDAVITAVGMTHHLSLMVLAVTLAIGIMIVVSRPLTEFVQKHPTVVMLCLGFLLMVGFTLVAEGLGAEIPKGYLYAAIGFSVLIESVNQFAQTKLKRRIRSGDSDVRLRTADAILKLMGAKPVEGAEGVEEANAILREAADKGVLMASEKEMLRGVLNLSTRQVRTVMTPRRDIEYVNIKDAPEKIFEEIRKAGRSRLLVVDGELDNVVGVVRKDEFLVDWLSDKRQPFPELLDEPLFVKDVTSVMSLLEFLKKYPAGLAVVTGDKGAVEGVITHIDLLEAIAGEFPSQDEPYAPPPIREGADGTISVDGTASIYDVCHRLGVDYTPDGSFATIAGLVLHNMGRMPKKGDTMDWQGWRFDIRQMEGRRIARIRITKIPDENAE